MVNKHCYESLDLGMNKTSGESVEFDLFQHELECEHHNTQMQMTDYVNIGQYKNDKICY